MNRSRPTAAALLALALTAGIATARIATAQVPGDYILSDLANNNVVATQPSAPLGVLFSVGPGRQIGDVVMHRDNTHLVANEIATTAPSSFLTAFNPPALVANYGARTPTDVILDGYGRYLATMLNGRSVAIVDAGIVTPLATGLPGLPVALTEDLDTGGLAVLTSTGTVLRVTPSGVFGQRKITGRGPGLPGTTWHLDLFFTCAGRPYATGISFGLRPGIPVGPTDVVSLAPDGLFVNALNGALDGVVLFGRVGTLDASGGATTRLRIPPTARPGTRIFASAIALCPGWAAGVAVGNTVGLTVR